MKRPFKSTAWSAGLLAASSLVAGSWLTPGAHAADKYDTELERRVELLERELNIMEGDKKGKNAESVEVPTFARAAKNVKELLISSEIRFRYDHSNIDGQAVDAEGQGDRLRFRLRLFFDYKLTENFFAGVALQTQQAADSGNQTYTEGFDNYNIYIWRAFVGWKPNDWITIVGGKQANPFYANTELLFDADISPNGLTEQIKIPISPVFELGVNAGQFIFQDNPENAFRNNPRTIVNAAGATVANPNFVERSNNNTDAYLAYQQIVATYKPSNDFVVTGSGGFLIYPGYGGTAPAASINNPAPGGPGAGNGTLLNSAAFNSGNSSRFLALGTATGDVKVALGAFKVKVYGDLVYNFKGGSRNEDIYRVGGADDFADKVAFAAGVTVGSDYKITKKGDYLLLAEYRHVGLGSIDPNINDSDFNGGRLNFRGIKTAASYAIYPWLIGSVTGYFSNNIGNTRDLNLGIANYNSSQTILVDLTAKF
jgi:hypothetical protein